MMVTDLKQAKADELTDCKDVVSKCDTALNLQIELNHMNKDIIKDYEHQSELQRQLIADKDRDLAVWYRNPLTVAGLTTAGVLVLGLVTGVLHGR